MNSVTPHTCPGCGRPLRQPRQKPGTAESAPVETAALSDADLFRYFHRTAPVEDLRFFLRYARLSPELQAHGDTMLTAGCRDAGGTLTRLDWYRRLTALQDRWRRDTADTWTDSLPITRSTAMAVAGAVAPGPRSHGRARSP